LVEQKLFHVVLSLQLKKLGLSTLTHLRRRRSRRPEASSDYVCPVEPVRPYAGFRGLSPILDREPAPSQS